MICSARFCLSEQAVATVVILLKSLYGTFQIVDTSFPDMVFHWQHEDVVAVYDPACAQSDGERQFYSRFKQAGGHMPVLSWDDIAKDLTIAAAPAHGEKTRILACCHADLLRSFEGQNRASTALSILSCGENTTAIGLFPLSNCGLVPQLSLELREGSEATFAHLLGRRRLGLDELDRVGVAARGLDSNVQIDLADATGGAAPSIRFDVPLQRPDQKITHKMARSLVHEGARASEGNADYSWLWMNGKRHIRFLIGRPPAAFQTIRVIVPNAYDRQNLAGAKVMLNGRAVPCRVEAWDDKSGAVSSSLAGEHGNCLVVGFSVPLSYPTNDGSAVLSACIDRIELQP